MENKTEAPPNPEEKIAKLQDEIILLRDQIEMLFELTLSATETLQANINGEKDKAVERLHHLVFRLRPLAQTLRDRING